jgi:2-dehydro-3-deoxyphosphogluconate aldolase / (4S)-4-hydroxy-2-oxoglutarate aldolase
MSIAFSPSLLSTIETGGVIAVLVIDRKEDAAPVAEALQAGGITSLELTLRTAAGIEALKEIKKHFPSLLVGAGTVLTPDQVKQVKAAGADFAVAPGTNHRVMAAAAAEGIAFGPGIATPSDIEAALEHGGNLLKFFPAEPTGGLAYLKTATAPYAHLDLKYIPLGGLTEQTMGTYLGEKSVAAIGGSWLAPRDLIQAGNWTEITARAKRASDIVRQTRAAK